MNLNKMFVFIFVFFLVFAALLVTMTPEFIQLGIESSVQDKEVKDYFDARDVTVYNQTYLLNLTYPCTEGLDWGLPEGQKLEFWWNYGMFELRHLTRHWTGWWWDWHVLRIQQPYARIANVGAAYGTLNKEQLLLLFDESYNASYCEYACDHISVKLFFVTANESWTLEESWDNGELRLFSSYDIDWTKSGKSMWFVMGQLLAFQNPQLGIPGVGGTILSVGFGGALWACIAILFYALITSVIPFISGWKGG